MLKIFVGPVMGGFEPPPTPPSIRHCAYIEARGGLEQELVPGGSVDRGPRVDLGRRSQGPKSIDLAGAAWKFPGIPAGQTAPD
jgi:hypothetical protein